MRTFPDLLTAFDNPTDLKLALGVGYQTARKMFERGSVASRHWPRFITALAGKGVKVTLEDLAKAEIHRATQSEENAA